MKSTRERKRAVATALSALLEPVAHLRKNPLRAMETPSKSIADVKRRAIAAADRLDGNWLLDLLKALPDDLNIDSVQSVLRQRLEEERARFVDSAVADSMLRLLDDARRNGPVSPALPLLTNFERQAIVDWTVCGRIAKCRRKRGERLMHATFDVIRSLEPAYAIHVRTLWCLAKLARGEWPTKPTKIFGALVRQTHEKLAHYPGLIDADAGHIRNAVIHCDYEFTEDGIIVLRDDGGKWQQPFRPSDLFERVRAMWGATQLRLRSLSLVLSEVCVESDAASVLVHLSKAVRGDETAATALRDSGFEVKFRKNMVRRQPRPHESIWFITAPVTEEGATISASAERRRPR